MTTNDSSQSTLTRQRIHVRGIVQGVGFRPFVFGLAARLGLSGFVGNNSAGVFIEIEGSADAADAFLHALRHDPPPLAHIEALSAEPCTPQGDTAFRIVESEAAGGSTLVSPDICVCDDCLRELSDPADRRYRYPFINCTNCGPRFTITRDVPYDRAATTMAAFRMCPTCQAEYDDPLNRRFHAQPNACPDCGPQIWLEAAHSRCSGDAALVAAGDWLRQGQIVAVKGIGGFHLACDATSDAALRLLRERKGRIDKPFALMARDLDTVRQFAHITDDEAALLRSRERPIVLLPKRGDPRLPLSELVAPGNGFIGVMLPYSPLHHLLLADLPFPLVMTSGNFSGEPIVTDNEAALTRLAPLADAFLLHDRAIHIPCDDSVIRVFEGVELPIRRSRGYAPFPVRLPSGMHRLHGAPSILAVGGELKNTFCLTAAGDSNHGDHAFLSAHIGDMENLETMDAFAHAVAHMQALFRVAPAVIACDLHPRYLSSRWAHETAARDGLSLRAVQHHHAHIAALMAEHDRHGPVIGVCFDGTGYGPDGAIWGGEVLIADYGGFTRAAHLKYIPLPGGDSAIRHPRRAALAHLWAAGLSWESGLPPVAASGTAELTVLRQQLERGLNTAPTSSMGRLFDAVAALIGVRQRVTYEAQAAIELEALADRAEDGSEERYWFTFDPASGVIDPAALLAAIAADVLSGVPSERIAADFHEAVVALIGALCRWQRQVTGLNQVALSGGVFQNVRLLMLAVRRLRGDGFEVYWHRKVPPNDGGLALGQALVAAHLPG